MLAPIASGHDRPVAEAGNHKHLTADRRVPDRYEGRWVGVFNSGNSIMSPNWLCCSLLDPSVDPSVQFPRRQAAQVIATTCTNEIRKYIFRQASESFLPPLPPLPRDSSLLFVTLHGPRCSAPRRYPRPEPDFLRQLKRMLLEPTTASNGTGFAKPSGRFGGSACMHQRRTGHDSRSKDTRNVMHALRRIADHRRLHGSPSGE